LSGPWIEEAGCQACEQLSPGERDCWGSDFFWRESSSSYKALRIPDPTLLLSLGREVEQPIDYGIVKVYILEVGQVCGE
jgi:hypothetical protein